MSIPLLLHRCPNFADVPILYIFLRHTIVVTVPTLWIPYKCIWNIFHTIGKEGSNVTDVSAVQIC